MEASGFNRTNRWKRKTPQRSPFLAIALLSLFFLFAFLLYLKSFSRVSASLISISRDSERPPQCSSRLGDKFLWYAPHSGFSNQLSEFKNALLMAAILNRTLIIPPVLDHHAVALGSCPKFRVLSPKELRLSVWNHIIQLIRDRRYVSLADVIDLSSVILVSKIRIMDFRVFVSMWCGVDVDLVCSEGSNTQSSLTESLRQCGSLLSGYNGNVNDCLFAVDEDCRTTVWTYQKDGEDGELDSFQPDEHLKKKKKILDIRRRKDVYKAVGPGSDAELASVLLFGSLFTAPYKSTELYVDIHAAPRDQRIQSLIEKSEFLPFAPEVMSAGENFALETIKAPFLCAQLRLLDGQFKNHWRDTFVGLKQKLESLRQKGPLPIHVFVMTDLPVGNWSESYLGELQKDSETYKLFVLREEDELVTRTSKKLVAAKHGMKFKPSFKRFNGIEKHCYPTSLPNILLYIEERICSCASRGFVGTAGSTIAASIELMRKYNTCSG